MHQVLLLCGSLRRESYNRMLLEVAAAQAPAHVTCRLDQDIGSLPHYNEDEDQDGANVPPAVARLRANVAACSGLIVAAPEYNHAVPGALKNAIDWASRPRGRAPLRGRAAFVLVATTAQAAGSHCHSQLRTLLVDLENFVVPAPAFLLQRAQDKLRRNEQGEAVLTDEVAHRLLRANWHALVSAMEHNAARHATAATDSLARLG